MLDILDLPTPLPGPGQIRVRVRAAGVQPIDCAVRGGGRAPGFAVEFPHITGGEFAGVVDALGEGGDGVETGSEVLGFRTRFTYAE